MAGGYSVDQPMGRDVVGPDGNEIAGVSDLLVEPDDRIRKTIVDMGGFLGVGAKPVVLDIGRLQRRGDSGDLHTSMTEEWLRALPRCERDGEGYYVQDNGGWPDGGRRAGEPDPARAGTSPSPDAPCRGWAEPDWRAPRSSPGLLASGSARSCASSGKSRS